MTIISHDTQFDVEVPEFQAFLECHRAQLVGLSMNDAVEVFCETTDGGGLDTFDAAMAAFLANRR